MRPTPLERLCAIGALVLLAAEVVFIAVGTTANLGGFLLMAAGVMVMILAFWYAVSRIGPARSIGAIVGVGMGITLFVIAVTVADVSRPRIVAIAGLAAMSIALGAGCAAAFAVVPFGAMPGTGPRRLPPNARR